MSADMSGTDKRRSTRSSNSCGSVVKPQAVSDKSYVTCVVDYLHDAYAGSKIEDKDKIQWVRFERIDTQDLLHHPQYSQQNNDAPLILTLGYANGIQIWSVLPNGDAHEMLSLRRGPVRIVKILPSPHTDKGDIYRSKRPLIAICDGVSSGQPVCSVAFQSLRTGEQVHTISFKSAVCDIHCTNRLIVVALCEKVAVFDAASFKSRFCITTCYQAEFPSLNPLSLGTRWLAYADKNLVTTHQSCGGVCRDKSQSYKATVIHAAKAISKGISAFSESIGKYASSRLSQSPPRIEVPSEPTNPLGGGTPGVVTIIDTDCISGEFSIAQDKLSNGIIAHFTAHINESIAALAFDPSGSLLLTAGSQGHHFHIFNIVSHPSSPSLGAVHHLYILHRGDTAAKVQDVCFSWDSRWVAVSTMRETTHVFPVTPYGGPVGARTHVSTKIVNKESKFRRSAGLEELESTGRHSPVHGLSESPTTGFYGPDTLSQASTSSSALSNPRIPPYPKPVEVQPYVQIKQPGILGSVGVVANSVASSPNRTKSPIHQSAIGEAMCLSTCFSRARTFQYGGTKVVVKDKPTAAVSLFIMNCNGSLVEHILEPRIASSATSTNKFDESPLELVTSIHAQWNLQRGSSWPEFPSPLSSSNLLMMMSDNLHHQSLADKRLCNSLSRRNPLDSFAIGHNHQETDFDEPWLALVEMDTHAGPHRRLWMGPQFIFKPVPQPSSTTVLSSTSSSLLDEGSETSRTALDIMPDDVDFKSLNLQPLRSEPLPTPRPGRAEPIRRRTSSSDYPTTSNPLSIEYGSGTFDHAVNQLEVSYGSCPDSLNSQRLHSEMEEHLKQTLAEAMAESPSVDEHNKIPGGRHVMVFEALSSSAGSSDSFPHSYEARCSPTTTVDHILVFPSSSGSLD